MVIAIFCCYDTNQNIYLTHELLTLLKLKLNYFPNILMNNLQCQATKPNNNRNNNWIKPSRRVQFSIKKMYVIMVGLLFLPEASISTENTPKMVTIEKENSFILVHRYHKTIFHSLQCIHKGM